MDGSQFLTKEETFLFTCALARSNHGSKATMQDGGSICLILGVFGITEILWETYVKRSPLQRDVTQPEVVVYGIREKL